jgi:hypothetical protein
VISPRPNGDAADREDGPVRALLISFFRLYLLFSLLVGICLILVSAVIRSSHGSEYVVDVIRDLGIGLVVSVFVVVFIEWRAGLTLRSEIAADVLAAVYRRTIPDIIFDQVRDSTFRSDVLRRGWEVEVSVVSPTEHAELYSEVREEAVSEEVFLIESRVTYELENLNDCDIVYPLTHGIDIDLSVDSRGIPCFTALEFDDDVHHFDSEEVFACFAEGRTFKTSDVTLSLAHPNEILASKQLRLERLGTTRIRYKLIRAIRAPGLYVISCATPADGIRIEIDGVRELSFDVRPLHPQAAHIDETEQGRRWEFAYGMLPWQGIQIVSYRELGTA